MSGREEQDFQRETWIQEKLNDQPRLLKDYMLSIKNKTSSTRKAYLGYLIQFVDFMKENEIDIENARPMHIDRYIDYISEGNGVSIVNTKLAAVSNFYGFLIKNELAKTNPIDADMRLKSEKEDRVIYMTDSEVERVKRRAINKNERHSNRDLCIITLGCATGLRVSAIRNIDIEDIDFENKSIRVIEKGNKERFVFIGDNTINVIKAWMKDRESKYGNNSGPLFLSQKGNRISVRTIEEMIHNVSYGLGKHITPHKMRSTCAMKLYNRTSDIYLTAQQLGHKNVATTMIYAKATDEKRREAAAILD